MKGTEVLNMITNVELIELSIPAPIFRLRFNIMKLLLEFLKYTTLDQISAKRLKAMVSEKISVLNKLLKELDE